MQTWLRSLGRKDPGSEKEMATHSSILACRIPMDTGAWQATVHEWQRVRHNCMTSLSHSFVDDLRQTGRYHRSTKEITGQDPKADGV